MPSRAGRSVLGALAWIAIGLAGFFVFRSEQQIASDRVRVRAFDQRAREATDALAEVRAAQQAYVAAGQSVPFWVAKVATTSDAVRATLAQMRPSAATRSAGASLDHATDGMTEFADADRRALQYINSGAVMMAGDVIFAEGGMVAALAGRDVEAARLAEHQGSDANQGVWRKQEAIVVGLAAGLVGIAVLLLTPLPDGGSKSDSFFVMSTDDRREGQDRREGLERRSPLEGLEEGAVLVARPARPSPASPPAHSPPSLANSRDELRRASAPPAVQPAGPTQAGLLKTAADLAAGFARVRNLHDLKDLLARSADVMDASGLIVWLGGADGSDLQPIVSHGYSPQAIARMPAVPRAGDNAAAAAYRTSTLQVVSSKPGGSPGALVAPIVAPEGCIGAFAAEIRSGGEGSESVRALATICAAQLAGIFSAAAADAPESKAANQ